MEQNAALFKTTGCSIQAARQICCFVKAFPSGINGTTIFKYELGSRNLKPDQLLKIANDLGVSIHVFTDFDIETASDVPTLLFKIDGQIYLRINGDKNGNLIPETTYIHFKHLAINDRLAKFA